MTIDEYTDTNICEQCRFYYDKQCLGVDSDKIHCYYYLMEILPKLYKEENMTETIKICDSCGKRVDWLYEIPRLVVEGNVINEYPGRTEICKQCAMILCERFNSFRLIKADEV